MTAYSTDPTLQQVYDCSIPAVVVLNSTNDGIIIRDSAGLIGSPLFAVQNNAGTVDFLSLSSTGASLLGGNNAGNILDLQGAISGGTDVGILRANSPITFTYDTVSNTAPAQQFLMSWSPAIAASSNYVGGCLQTAATFTITTGVFVPAIFSDTNIYAVGAVPGFSAITFINELSTVRNSGNFNLPGALVMNIGLTHERNTSGTSTTTGTTGVSFSPQTRTTVSGAILTKTNQTAVRCSPTFSTVAGSTANLGIITGLLLFQPAVALFQPGAGSETMVAYRGVDFPDMTFGGTGANINVIRSALNSAAGGLKFFLNHFGTAPSRLRGQLQFDVDLTGVTFGASGDISVGWGNDFLFHNFTGLGTGVAGQWRFATGTAGATTQRHLWQASVQSAELNINVDRFSLGAQAGSNGNQVGNFVTPARTIGLAGDWADFLLTQAGNLTVAGFAMGRVSAWVINPVSYATSTGSVGNADTLTVGGFPTSSPGVTITARQSLNVIGGRSRLASTVQYPPINPAALSAGNNNNWAGLLTGSANNSMRFWARVTGAAAAVLTGIDSTSVQDGDTFEFTNVGANAITINNQDANSTAANRIITGTGAAFVLAVDGAVKIRYDVTTARWRLMQRF